MGRRRKFKKSLAECWTIVGNSMKYRRAAVREASRNSLDDIKGDVFDGILIALSPHNSGKSMSVQKRVLRRIVEKRQAQIAHRYIGRTDDLLASRIVSVCSSRCMRRLHQYQNCI